MLGRGSTTLTKATLAKGAEDDNLLPDDVHYHVADLTKLFTKPNWSVGFLLTVIVNSLFLHFQLLILLILH